MPYAYPSGLFHINVDIWIQLGISSHTFQNPKSEGRRPKEIRGSNSEATRLQPFRVSDFELLSAFGFRISDFNVIAPFPAPNRLRTGPRPLPSYPNCTSAALRRLPPRGCRISS